MPTNSRWMHRAKMQLGSCINKWTVRQKWRKNQVLCNNFEQRRLSATYSPTLMTHGHPSQAWLCSGIRISGPRHSPPAATWSHSPRRRLIQATLWRRTGGAQIGNVLEHNVTQPEGLVTGSAGQAYRAISYWADYALWWKSNRVQILHTSAYADFSGIITLREYSVYPLIVRICI